MKFKVGDIVRGTKEGWYGITNAKITRGEVIEVLNPKENCDEDIRIRILEHPLKSVVGVTGCVESKYFELVERKNETIVIYRKGNEVVALDKSLGKKATAKCSPEDEFDFYTGAKIAFNRLMKPQLLNTKICITKSCTMALKIGKIYEIKDGRFKDDESNEFPKHDPLVDIEDLRLYFTYSGKRKCDRIGCYGDVNFVEVVE